MKFTSTSEKQKLSLLFAGYYVSSAVLILLLLTVFLVNRASDHLDNGRKNGLTGEQQLAQACSLLQERLRDLQQLDEKYTILIRDSGVKANYDVLTGRIKNSEVALRRVIDSVDKLSLYGNMRDQMNQLSYSCKAVLEYHRSIDELQQAVALASKQLNLDQRSLIGLSRTIAKRDSIIADIKVHSQSDNNSRYDSKFSDADYRLLKSENNYLKSELELMQRQFQAFYEKKMAQSPDTKTAKSQHLNQTGKSAVTPTLNTGTNTKEVKYEGDPPKQ
jgi:hypothetical protein